MIVNSYEGTGSGYGAKNATTLLYRVVAVVIFILRFLICIFAVDYAKQRQYSL